MASEIIKNDTTPPIEEPLTTSQFSRENFFKDIFLCENDFPKFYTFLKSHWKHYVAQCYRVTEDPEQLFLEVDAGKLLFRPLEAYLCKSLDSLSLLETLTQLDSASKICGKIFKFEEKAYFCQDCSCDITRVLCNDCFVHSKHREHRYKILKTEGNGYCDCGDIDAWKNHPACDKHTSEAPANQDDSIETIINKLPIDLVDRFTKLIKCVLNYMIEILSITGDCHDVPDELSSDNNSYVVFIYKNDTQVFDVDIDNIVRNLLQVDVTTARLYASIFKKQGRCPVKIGSKKECDIHKNLLNNRKTSHLISKVSVLSQTLVSHQCFAEQLLIWLEKLGQYSKCLSCLSCKLLFSNASHSEKPYILSLMSLNLHSWQNARENMHLLIVNTVLMNSFWKREFAVLYANNYNQFVHAYLVTRNFTTLTTLNLTVQIFPVSSLTNVLIEKCNLFQVITETLFEITQMEAEGLKFLTFSSEKSHEYILSKLILIDLSYLLTNVPKEWTAKMRANFLNGFRVFVRLMKRLQGMNSVVRYTSKHIEFEPEWEKSYFFLSRLQKPLLLLIEWCSRDKLIFNESLKLMLNKDFEEFRMTDSLRELNNQLILTYDTLQEEVSLHAHFTRFICVVMSQAYKFYTEVQFRELVQTIIPVYSKALILCLIEPSVRAYLLYSQVNCGIWKKNGISLLNQTYLYHNIMFRNEFLDRDIVALQVGAAYLDPNQYLINLLHRFNLQHYLLDPNYEIPDATKETEQDLTYLKKLSEYFLELLIYIHCERYETHLSRIEPNERLEREVLHFLCNVEPMSFSFLSTKIYRDLEHYTNDIDLTTVLNKIAIVKNSDKGNKSLKSIYELRPEYIDQYSPFFYHYSNNEKAQSDEKLDRLRKVDPDFFIKPPNKFPRWQTQFAGVRKLLDSDVFVRIVECMLIRVSQASNTNAEGQFMKLLYLIGLALHEDFNEVVELKKTGKKFEFGFIEKAEKTGIKLLLKNTIGLPYLLSGAKYKASAEWTFNYYLKLIELKLQDSDLSEFKVNACISSNDIFDKELEKRKHLKLKAEKRRQKIMSKFERMQQNFVDTMKLDNSLHTNSCSKSASSLKESTLSGLRFKSNEIVCFGRDRNINEAVSAACENQESFTCILCQQEENASEDTSPMILLCYTQKSRVLCKEKNDSKYQDSYSSNIRISSRLHGINTTTCGHTMHSDCWEKYINSINLHNTILNKELGETFCPLCETISNIVISISHKSSEGEATKAGQQPPNSDFETWFSALQKDQFISEENTSEVDMLSINSSEEKGDCRANQLLIDLKQKQLVDEYTVNSTKLTSYRAGNRANFYSTILSNCSYTIQVTDQLLALGNKQHFLSIPEKQATLISGLIEQSHSYIRQNRMDPILKFIQKDLLDQIMNTEYSSETVSLSEVDMFSVLTSLSFLFSEADQFFLLQLVLKTHCLQILFNQLISKDGNNNEVSFIEGSAKDSDSNLKSVDAVLAYLAKSVQKEYPGISCSHIDANKVKMVLKRSLIQFLSCSALFYSGLYRLNAKKCEIVETCSQNINTKFNELLKFLGLETSLDECLNINRNSVQIICNKMVKDFFMQKENLKLDKLNIPLEANMFVPLPDDYLDLISMCSSNDNAEFLNILCLVCGEMLRKGSSVLNDRLVGACTAHTHKCCLNNGVFLKIDECKILLLQLKFSDESILCEVTGCYVSAPFLDDYGETDQDFLKGNPLHLCKNNYQRLYYDWISHAIPERIFSHNRYRINHVDMSSV